MPATEHPDRVGSDRPDADRVEARWREVGAYIREQRRVTRLSLRRLSELAGVSNPYLSQIERGMRRPSAEILQQIARALQISSETLYVRAGFLDEERTVNQPVDVPAAVSRDPHLDDEQRRRLLHLDWAFRDENSQGQET